MQSLRLQMAANESVSQRSRLRALKSALFLKFSHFSTS